MKLSSLKNKIIMIINRQKYFLKLLMFFLLIDYALLFSFETILPGFVIESFNLNLLLIAVLIIWLFLVLTDSGGDKNNAIRILKLLVWLVALVFAIALFFGFLGISFWEMGIYFILIIILFKIIWYYMIEE